MPLQSVWMIRLALVYLLIAILLGGLLLLHKTVEIHPGLWALLPLHFELAIWGWLIQFVMGTAYWMFPRHLQGDARGHSGSAWAMLLFFNTGLFLILFTHIKILSSPFFAAGRFLLALSSLLFIFLMWKRVVSYRATSI